jgi:hypothetical protein
MSKPNPPTAPRPPPPKVHPTVPGLIAKPQPKPTIAQAMYPGLPSTEPKEPRS